MDSYGIGRCSISFKWGKVGWKSALQVRPDRSSSVAGVGQRRRVAIMSSSLSSSLVSSSLSSFSSTMMTSLPLPSSNCQWRRAPMKNEGTFATEEKNFVGVPTLRQQHRKLPSHSRGTRRISCHSFISADFGSAIADGLTLVVQEPILRDTLAFVFSAIGAKGLVNAFEFLESSGYIDKKLSRKLVHTLAGPLFIACWPLFSNTDHARYVAALVPALNGIRLFLIGSGVVRNERAVSAVSRTGDPSELLRGPLYYVIVLILVTALYWRASPTGIVVASLMCGGDGLADIVGRRFGSSNPLPWNPSKSWAGSLAMFLGGFAMSAALIIYLMILDYMKIDSFFSTMLLVLCISAAAALIESLPINNFLDDNISVPLSAAALGTIMLQFIVVL